MVIRVIRSYSEYSCFLKNSPPGEYMYSIYDPKKKSTPVWIHEGLWQMRRLPVFIYTRFRQYQPTSTIQKSLVPTPPRQRATVRFSSRKGRRMPQQAQKSLP